jgi:hypothetical protein
MKSTKGVCMCVCVVLVLIKFRLFLVRPENDITEIDDAPHDVRSFRQILFLISPPKIKIQLIWVYVQRLVEKSRRCVMQLT